VLFGQNIVNIQPNNFIWSPNNGPCNPLRPDLFIINIPATGGVGIGTTTPTLGMMLSVNGNADKVGGGAWAVFSDKRLKKDIEPFNDGLSLIEQIDPVSFVYNGKGGITSTERYVGVIAQDIQKIAPYTIRAAKMKLDPADASESDILSFDPSALDFILINAVKEQQKIIVDQQKQIDELKKLVDQLINKK
jgi:trimeric autotransporter adhesin